MPRYYVREFYVENILEKKLVSNLLRGFGKNALTTKKNQQQNAQSLRNNENMMTVTISN